MVQTDRRARLLQRMFTEAEWDCLWQHRTFRLALDSAGDTLDDVEKLAFLGDQLIHAAVASTAQRSHLERLRNQLN